MCPPDKMSDQINVQNRGFVDGQTTDGRRPRCSGNYPPVSYKIVSLWNNVAATLFHGKFCRCYTISREILSLVHATLFPGKFCRCYKISRKILSLLYVLFHGKICHSSLLHKFTAKCVADRLFIVNSVAFKRHTKFQHFPGECSRHINGSRKQLQANKRIQTCKNPFYNHGDSLRLLKLDRKNQFEMRMGRVYENTWEVHWIDAALFLCWASAGRRGPYGTLLPIRSFQT